MRVLRHRPRVVKSRVQSSLEWFVCAVLATVMVVTPQPQRVRRVTAACIREAESRRSRRGVELHEPQLQQVAPRRIAEARRLRSLLESPQEDRCSPSACGSLQAGWGSPAPRLPNTRSSPRTPRQRCEDRRSVYCRACRASATSSPARSRVWTVFSPEVAFVYTALCMLAALVVFIRPMPRPQSL